MGSYIGPGQRNERRVLHRTLHSSVDVAHPVPHLAPNADGAAPLAIDDVSGRH